MLPSIIANRASFIRRPHCRSHCGRCGSISSTSRFLFWLSSKPNLSNSYNHYLLLRILILMLILCIVFQRSRAIHSFVIFSRISVTPSFLPTSDFGALRRPIHNATEHKILPNHAESKDTKTKTGNISLLHKRPPRLFLRMMRCHTQLQPPDFP